MHSTVSIDIVAPAELVFRLARDIERWPRLLPHYLSVRVEGRGPDGTTTLRMIAVRPLLGLLGLGLPVVWRARTWAEPEQLRLRFRHVGGVTAGMDVTWRIESTPAGCHVAIEHAFRRRLPIPMLGNVLGDEALPAFVDRFFTRPIAQRTLATFGALAEAIAQTADVSDTSDEQQGAYPIT
jgi:ribosome-associated toxin RatA of RatAB toxin-antitoxin module